MNKNETSENKKFTVTDAYNLTMAVIRDLEEKGMQVKQKVPKSATRKDTVEKYDTPDNIPAELWRHVTFVTKTAEESKELFDATIKLRKYGIGFDTGAGCGGRDWEIDWSFSYKEGRALDHGLETSLKWLEGQAKKLCDKESKK